MWRIRFTTLTAVDNDEYPKDAGFASDFNMTFRIPFRVQKSVLAFHDPDITYQNEWRRFVAADSLLDVKLDFFEKFVTQLGSLTNIEVYPPGKGFFLPRFRPFSDQQEVLPLQFKPDLSMQKVRPFQFTVELNGTTLYPVGKFVQSPGGVNLKVVCTLNDSRPLDKETEPVQNWHWYVIGNSKLRKARSPFIGVETKSTICDFGFAFPFQKKASNIGIPLRVSQASASLLCFCFPEGSGERPVPVSLGVAKYSEF